MGVKHKYNNCYYICETIFPEMYNEITFTAIMLGMLLVAFLLLDLILSGILALIPGWHFGTIFRWGLLGLLIPPLALGYAIIIERNTFKVNEIELSFRDLPEAFDGYRIAHISDIHARSFSKRTASLEKAVGKINALRPDLIAFTGDLITITPDELAGAAPLLRGLTAPDGVVSVLGNHDYCTRLHADRSPDAEGLAELCRLEREMGWKLLLNESTLVRRGSDSLYVVGVENVTTSPYFPSTGDLGKASEGTEGTFRILLTHDPTHWDAEVLGKDFPLTLSGHTHAGQATLFGWSPAELMFSRVRGLFCEGGQYLYVNSGLGESIFPGRFCARPEISIITLRANLQH